MSSNDERNVGEDSTSNAENDNPPRAGRGPRPVFIPLVINENLLSLPPLGFFDGPPPPDLLGVIQSLSSSLGASLSPRTQSTASPTDNGAESLGPDTSPSIDHAEPARNPPQSSSSSQSPLNHVFPGSEPPLTRFPDNPSPSSLNPEDGTPASTNSQSEPNDRPTLPPPPPQLILDLVMSFGPPIPPAPGPAPGANDSNPTATTEQPPGSSRRPLRGLGPWSLFDGLPPNLFPFPRTPDSAPSSSAEPSRNANAGEEPPSADDTTGTRRTFVNITPLNPGDPSTEPPPNTDNPGQGSPNSAPNTSPESASSSSQEPRPNVAFQTAHFHIHIPILQGPTPDGRDPLLFSLAAMFGLGGERERPPDPRRAKQLLRALEQVPLGLLKRLERVEKLRGGSGVPNCAVCLESLQSPPQNETSTDAEETREGPDTSTPATSGIVALPCQHAYHANCLSPWLATHTTCPACRFDLDPSSLTLRAPTPSLNQRHHPYARRTATGQAPERQERPKWTLPEGKTLRSLVEDAERSLSLRCDDLSCGLGPSDDDDDALVDSTPPCRKQISLVGHSDERSCSHRFHPSCLVTSARVAGRSGDGNHGPVQIPCPCCRIEGRMSREDWDEGATAF